MEEEENFQSVLMLKKFYYFPIIVGHFMTSDEK